MEDQKPLPFFGDQHLGFDTRNYCGNSEGDKVSGRPKGATFATLDTLGDTLMVIEHLLIQRVTIFLAREEESEPKKKKRQKSNPSSISL